MPLIGKKAKEAAPEEKIEGIEANLSKLYYKKLLPLEETYQFHEFHSPKLDAPDFTNNNPMVLFVGQYSTGKTTFIKYLLEEDFPGMRIGPEPTTEKFTAIMHGQEERIIPGNAVVLDNSKIFCSLAPFGNNFLNRFVCTETPNSVLESMSLVDTPGILSGTKQSTERGYDFTGVLRWFAERVDRIILIFDAHSLDVSDEYKEAIEALHGFDDKIRIVLNKSDTVSTQQLMRVYGAIMWALGRIVKSPEVTRVYVGSFWAEALQNDVNRRLFELEENDLFEDLKSLPRNAALRKLNDFIRRAKLAKVHAYILTTLKEEMPAIRKGKKKETLIKNLSQIYAQISKRYEIPLTDFPDVERMQETLAGYDFTKFHPLKAKLIDDVENMLSRDMAKLIQLLPQESETNSDKYRVRGGAFGNDSHPLNPFSMGAAEGYKLGAGTGVWVVEDDEAQYERYLEQFDELGPIVGVKGDKVIPGAIAKEELQKSKLPKNALGKIWTLSDIDQDGALDEEEWCLAMYLVDVKIKGDGDLPTSLHEHLVPPGKRRFFPQFPAIASSKSPRDASRQGKKMEDVASTSPAVESLTVPPKSPTPPPKSPTPPPKSPTPPPKSPTPPHKSLSTPPKSPSPIPGPSSAPDSPLPVPPSPTPPNSNPGNEDGPATLTPPIQIPPSPIQTSPVPPSPITNVPVPPSPIPTTFTPPSPSQPNPSSPNTNIPPSPVTPVSPSNPLQEWGLRDGKAGAR